MVMMCFALCDDVTGQSLPGGEADKENSCKRTRVGRRDFLSVWFLPAA